MGKKEIISILRDYKRNSASKYGIQALGLFGSLARGEAREDSDVDIVIKFDRPNLITMSRIRLEIEELTRRHVDIIHYRQRMNKLLKERIDREAVYV
jgi:hypothetical protein